MYDGNCFMCYDRSRFAGSNNKSVKSAKYNAYATEYVGFVSAGSGNTYGYAAMDFEGSTYEIHATD